MTESQLTSILADLLNYPSETEWIEYKQNNFKPEDIGEYISALSNSACLHRKEFGYIVWGIEDQTKKIVGTDFKPRKKFVKGQELENWLATNLNPRINFEVYEFNYKGFPIVLFEIQECRNTPVAFKGTKYIRVGSYKKPLNAHPEKERALWIQCSKTTFEKGVAKSGVNSDEVLSLIDYPGYFELSEKNLPDSKSGILECLKQEKIVLQKGDNKYDITNLGAVLFAKDLSKFSSLKRKAVRVIFYKGTNKIEALKELEGKRGYASGFQNLIEYINSQLPSNEQLGQALRKKVSMFPEIAVREVVANAIIHQDFNITGDSPMIEIFSDRIEITNSGVPLIDTLRFIDEPPQSRNEELASFMRRLNICEERGSGVDKIIVQTELYQLPAPKFSKTENHTKVILFAFKKLSQMDRKDKIRACYQHATLKYISNDRMTNSTLRERFAIEDKNYSMASRIIADTLEEGFIKPSDPTNKSKKHAKYIPFWA